MAAPTRPAATKAYLRKKIILVKDAAYDPAAPSLAILNGASALDVTNMFFASTYPRPITVSTPAIRSSKSLSGYAFLISLVNFSP